MEILPHEARMVGGYRPINNAPEMEIGQSKPLDASVMVGVDDPLGGSGERWVTLIRPIAASSQGAWVYTIAFGVSGEAAPPGPVMAQRSGLLGQVLWGVGGAKYNVIFDLKVGTNLTVLGSSLEASAGFSEINANTPARALVSAGLAHGPRPGCCYLTRTFPTQQLGGEGGLSAVYQIPSFAYAVQVFAETTTLTEPYTAGAFEVELLGGPDPVTAQNFLTLDAPVFLGALSTGGVKINNQARYLRLAADNIADYTVMFVLGL